MLGSIGLTLNIFVIAITLSKKLRVYKWFLCNLAFADFVFLFTLLCFQPFFVLHPLATGSFCGFVGFLTTSSTLTMIYSLPLLGINRYISICRAHLYPKMFSKRMTALYCVCTWVLGILAVLFLGALLGNFGRSNVRSLGNFGRPNVSLLSEKPSLICSFEVKEDPNSIEKVFDNISSFVVLCTLICSFVLIGFCSFKVHQKLKIQNVALLNLQQARKLVRNRMLMEASIMQGILPLVIFLPFVALLVISQFYLNFTGEDFKSSGWREAIVSSSVSLNAVFDALTTLIVVAPYSKAMKAWFSNLRKGKFSFQAVQQEDDQVIELN